MEKNKKVHLNKNEIQDVNGGGGQCPHCHGELPPLHPIVFGPPPPPPPPPPDGVSSAPLSVEGLLVVEPYTITVK